MSVVTAAAAVSPAASTSAAIPIVYSHNGFPKYLYASLESARFFNPDSRIFLVSNMPDLRLDELGVEIVPAASLIDERIQTFRRNFVHISTTKVGYAKVCIERWFLIGTLIRQRGFPRMAYLDSDALLFHDLRDSFRYIDERPCLLVSHGEGPALTVINRNIDPFLDFINAKFLDRSFLESYRVRNQEARAAGRMVNLDDMEFFKTFAQESDGRIASYPNNLPIGHIDHCINGPGDGMMSRPTRRHLARKRVYWEDDGKAFRPHFRSAIDGSMVPALVIHFQSGAKRRIRRFNRVNGTARLPRAWRLRYYHHLLN